MNHERPIIILRRTPSCWTATFVNDAEVLRLFGTDTLPTAFTAKAPQGMVLEAVRAKNSDCDVMVTS